MVSILLGIGILGILGSTVLCPIVSFFAYRLQRRLLRLSDSNIAACAFPSTVEVIVPAHNEAAQIGDTLDGIQRSIDRMNTDLSEGPPPVVTVHVGADGCTDGTAEVVRRRTGVRLTESREKNGKWTVLTSLASVSSAEWVFFADAGTVWRSDFLIDALKGIGACPDAIGVAPSYRPLKARGIPQLLWKLETALKKMEARCGGPVSLHGATVGYKTDRLKKALGFLEGTRWLNDDIVIPLALRASYPKGVILYPVGQIQDAGGKFDRLDVGRRKRMLLGNLQWTKALLPACFRMNRVAAWVALRRVFRILWAYWLGCLALAAALAFHILILPAAAIFAALILFSGSFRQIAGAAWVSLLTPYRIARLNEPQVSWK
jgi:glycosyltransferase involved in cell wall biosynthesis